MQLEGVQIGSYRLLHLIGGGGMGDVYLAEDMRVNRQVAIKVIQTKPASHIDINTVEDAVRLFQREVKAIANLDHPHILPFFDCGGGNFNGIYITYMVMPFRREGSLLTWLRMHSPSKALVPSRVAHFVHQAADALQYAHDQQIIHRDVKPSNFLIRSNKENPDTPDLLLADFGLVKFSTITAAISRGNYGTPIYMAPEHWDGRPVPATDQYALAVMAYELLTGRPPFLGNQQQVMYQHLQVEPQPPSKLNPSVPASIDAVILRALAKRPEDRYNSISVFAQAFGEAVQGAGNTYPPGRTSSPGDRYPVPQTGNTIRSTGNHKIPAQPNPRPYGPLLQSTDNLNQGKEALSISQAGLPVIQSGSQFSRQGRHPGDGVATRVSTPTDPIVASDKGRTEGGRGRSTGGALSLIGLVLLFLIMGGGVFASFVSISRIPGAPAGVTTTAQVTTSTTAHTATVITTASTLQNPYPPHKGMLAFNDPLHDNSNGYNWDEVTDSNGSCTFTGEAYHIATTKQGHLQACTASTNFSNFVYQVQMTIVAGDYGGIMFRVDSTHSKFYYFRIGQDGSYELALHVGNTGSDIQVLKSGTSSVIKTERNASNVIAVVASGSDFDLYVNHQHIAYVSDSTHSQGQIGVCAEESSQSTEVIYNNAQVWTL